MATTAAIVGLAVAAGGTAYSVRAQRKAAHFQRADIAAQRQSAALQNLQRRRAEAKAALANRSKVLAAQSNLGAGATTSSANQASGSAVTTGGQRTSFLDQLGALNSQRFEFAKRSTIFEGQAQVGQQVTSFGKMAMDYGVSRI